MPSSRAGARPSFQRARQRAIKGRMVLDEATERRLRRIRLRRAATVLAAIGLMAAALALYLSPLLRVQSVEIVGADQVDAEEVAELASLEGDSMFRLDLAEVQERIRFLPLVKSVRVERNWPQTVRIVISERTPWGFWQVNEAPYVIDSEGVVLPGLQPPEGAPLIKDLSNPVRLVPGDHVDMDAVALSQTLLQRVPEALTLNISGLEYSPEKGLALVTDAGYRVVLGDSQNVEYKLAVWKAIEGQLGRESMSGHVLDLRFEERPSFQ